MITLEKFRKVAGIISNMANIPPGVRDPLAEAAAWGALQSAVDNVLMFWEDDNPIASDELIAAMDTLAALREAQHE